jgi:hypothetical protein
MWKYEIYENMRYISAISLGLLLIVSVTGRAKKEKRKDKNKSRESFSKIANVYNVTYVFLCTCK